MRTSARIPLWKIACITGIALTIIAGAAEATESAGLIEVRPAGELTPFEPGVPKIFAIELLCDEPADIENIRLEGKSWLIAAVDVPAKASLRPPDPLRLEFDLLTVDDSHPVELTFTANGTERTLPLDLSREFITGEKAVGRLEVLDEFVPEFSPGPDLTTGFEGTTEEPVFHREAPDRKELDDEDNGIARRRQITVRGRVLYRTDTGNVVPAHGASAQIVDEDWGSDDFLGAVMIGDRGYFEITVSWSPQIGDSNPDIYLRVVSGNSRITVRSYWLNWLYSWETPTWDDETRAELDLGERIVNGNNVAALNILKSMTRAEAWFMSRGQSVLPPIEVFWPTIWPNAHFDVPDMPWETSHGQIHITDDHSWSEQTSIHEFGHFWVYNRARRIEPDYCVYTYCAPIEWYEVWKNCGHCRWCPEGANVAFYEGFSEWLPDVVMRWWNQIYDDPYGGWEAVESLQNCPNRYGASFLGDPWITEGSFAALLRDIEDRTNEDDPKTPGFSDALEFSPTVIIDLIDEEHPVTPSQFIQQLLERKPYHAEMIWETCENNGYSGMDTTNPQTGLLTSSSHQANVPSTKDKVFVSFDQASDNLSGIGGFAYEISEDEPVAPGFTHEGSTPWMEFTTNHLSPGTWFITLRVHDRAMNWDSSYGTLGPIIIQAPDPGNLRPEAPDPGWAHPIVPRTNPDATDTSVPTQASTIYANSWYWNASVVNYGEAAIFDHSNHVLLDGVWIGGFGEPIGQDTHRWAINQGPLMVPGGRHTLELFADGDAEYAEPDETDNGYARQWVWSPTSTVVSGVARRSSPPVATAGWQSVTGQFPYFNCYGFRLITLDSLAPSSWVLAAVKADSLEDDLDVRLYDQATSSTDGFAGSLGNSLRPAGYLDAVLVNAANRPATFYDVGVANRSEGLVSDYDLIHQYGEPRPLGDVLTDSLVVGEALRIFTFETVEAYPHLIDFDASVQPGDGTIYAAWFDEGFTTGALLDYTDVAATGYGGLLQLEIDPAPGEHALVIWRDPADDDFAKRDFTLLIRKAETDLLPYLPTGWAAPLVPRPAQDATFSFAPEPTLLDGDAYSTYLNFAAMNVGPATSGDFTVELLVDRIAERFASYSGFGPGTWVSYTPQTPIVVRGGRHVVAMEVDYSNTQEELSETNNVYGTQYVWEPAVVGLFSTGMRAEPPFRTADWERVTTDEVLYTNCDAVRTMIFNPGPTHGNWGGFAVIPGEFSDVDIELHDLSTGARDGFTDPLASSMWSTGELDLVLMNFRNTPTRQFDVGLTMGITQKVEDYKWMLTNSTWVGVDPGLGVGPYTMSSNSMLLLFEFRFDTPGLYHATLDVQDPSLDLGFSLYGPDAVYVGKEDIYGPTSAAWLEPAGADETFDFVVHESRLGYFCVAVWKVGYYDLPRSGDFTLNFVRDTFVDAPELVIPTVTALRGVAPNPFNPSTTVSFDLASDAHVRIAVYDIAGARVRTLFDRKEIAGPHSVIWDGRDQNGRGVASGIYIVQMEAGGVRETKKVALIK